MSPSYIAFPHSFSVQANLLCWQQLRMKLRQPQHVEYFSTHYNYGLWLLCSGIVHVCRLMCLHSRKMATFGCKLSTRSERDLQTAHAAAAAVALVILLLSFAVAAAVAAATAAARTALQSRTVL